MSVTSNTVSVKENDNVNLTCDASGYPTPNITWVRVNGNVLPNEELRHRVSTSKDPNCLLWYRKDEDLRLNKVLLLFTRQVPYI